MHARHVPVYLVLLGVLNTVYAGFDEGFSAFQRGDFTAALRVWRPLAEQGNAAAQSNLGMMYVQGKSVPQDFKEAIKWYRLAAEQGAALARSNLGVLYANGYGVPQNHVVAYALFSLAAASAPDSIALEERDRITASMTPQEIEAAQKLTQDMSGNPIKAIDAYLH